MQSLQFSHWLLVLVQALRVAWALLLRLVPGCGRVRGVGICECEDSLNEDCWRDQLAFRTEASSLLIYIALAGLTCADRLKQRHSVILVSVIALESFLMLPMLLLPIVMFQFLDVFSMFAAALYRVMQAVLFMDGAYQLNDRIYASAVQARRRSISSEAFHGRLALMVSVSLALVIGALIAAIYLCMAVPEVTICVVSAVVGSSLLLLVSITSWCEHGSLMTSSVMFAYNIYLCYQVASIRPRAEEEEIPTTMLGLLVPTLSLAYFAISKSPARHLAGRKQNSSDTTDDFDPNDFLLRCFVHFLADFYVTSVLAPRVSWLRFNIRAATVFVDARNACLRSPRASASEVCLAVYAWTLVAPKVLPDRDF
ncbi:unnamed protein product [Durusdinium trenchii]|uniref:Uncharacterized protein n=1 Tax=Durusdinium trenchii TaxID=1381693 RepID=A0ABP0J8X1_9DINO